MYDLTRKIALVTGIGGPVDALGNGKAIAMLLAKQGAIIEGTDIDEAAGANTVAAIRDAGGMAHCSTLDATDQTGVEDWVKACAAKHGRIDILVNNVGQSEPGGPVSMDAATWQAQIALNLDAAFIPCKPFCHIWWRRRPVASLIFLQLRASVISANRRLAMRRLRPG